MPSDDPFGDALKARNNATPSPASNEPDPFGDAVKAQKLRLAPENQNITITPPKDYTWGEAFKGGAENAFDDTLKFGKNVFHAYTHPVETMGKAANLIGAIDVGLAKTAGGTVFASMSPEVRAMIAKDHPEIVKMVQGHEVSWDKASDAALAVRDQMIDRYGSFSGIRRAIHDHPIEVATDLSTLLTGGAGLAGKAGLKGTEIALATGGDLLNPLSHRNALFEAARAASVTPVVGPIAKSAVTKGIEKTGEYAGKFADSFVVPQNINPLKGPLNPYPVGIQKAAQNDMLLKAAEDPQAMSNALRNPQSIIPGAPVSAAEATVDTGIVPWQSMLDKATAQEPTRANAMDDARRAAELKHVGRIGGTFDRDALDLQLWATENQNYGISRKPQFRQPLEGAINSVLNRDVNKDVLKNALVVNPNAVVTESQARLVPQYGPWTNVPADPYMGKPGHRIREKLDPITVYDENHLLTGSGVQSVKKQLDDMFLRTKNPVSSGYSPETARALNDSLNDYLGIIDDNNPAHKIARNTSKALHDQIDRAKARDLLVERLDKSPGTFRSGQDTVANEVRGNSIVEGHRQEQLKDILTPGEMKILDDVMASLDRSDKVKKLAGEGVDQRNNVTTALSDYVGGPPRANLSTSIPRQVLNALMGGGDDAILERVSKSAHSPAEMNELLDDAIKRQAQMLRWKQRMGALYDGATKYPMMYNILNAESPPREQR